MKDGKSTVGIDQFAALTAAVIRSLPRDMDTKTAQEWIQNPKDISKALRRAFMPPVKITFGTINEVYFHLGIDCEFPDDVKIPEGFVWPIVVPKGMTPGKALAIASKLFPTRECDMDIGGYEKASITTARFFKADIDADEEHKKKSAEMCEAENIQGITLTERILLEVVYFKATGHHLDKDAITLCTGSLHPKHGVPFVSGMDKSHSRFVVGYYSPDYYSSDLRVREVVSAKDANE